MRFYALPLLSTLVLAVCLKGGVAEKGEVAASAGEQIVNNGTAIANGTDVAGQDGNANQDQQDDGGEDVDQNNNDNLDIDGALQNEFNDINIDPNNIQGSLGQNILDLMLALGICNFNLNSISGLSLGNEIQLLLQLQQLQQLQALGIVNSFAVDQLIQQEILSRTFNLNIVKRSIDTSVRRASKGKKRTTILKRQCANVDLQRGNENGQAGQNQDQANQDQANQDQVNQDQANQDQANQDQANEDQANQDQENEDQENQDQADQDQANADQENENESEEQKDDKKEANDE